MKKCSSECPRGETVTRKKKKEEIMARKSSRSCFFFFLILISFSSLTPKVRCKVKIELDSGSETGLFLEIPDEEEETHASSTSSDSTRYFTLLQPNHAVSVKASFGPIAVRETIYPQEQFLKSSEESSNLDLDTSEPPIQLYHKPDLDPDLKEELLKSRNKSSSSSSRNGSKSGPGHVTILTLPAQSYDVSAHLVTREVTIANPELRVLFYAGHSHQAHQHHYRSSYSHASSSRTGSKSSSLDFDDDLDFVDIEPSASNSDSGHDDQESTKNYLCAVVIVSKSEDEKVFGSCSPSSSSEGSCLASVLIPSNWWPTNVLEPFENKNINNNFKSSNSKSSRSSNSNYKAGSVSVEYVLIKASSFSEKVLGLNPSFEHVIREMKTLPDPLPVGSINQLPEVRLELFSSSFEEVSNDNMVKILIPRISNYVNKKIYLPVIFNHNPNYNLAAFSIRVKIKSGIKILAIQKVSKHDPESFSSSNSGSNSFFSSSGSSSSSGSNSWHVSSEVSTKGNIATVTCYKKESDLQMGSRTFLSHPSYSHDTSSNSGSSSKTSSRTTNSSSDTSSSFMNFDTMSDRKNTLNSRSSSFSSSSKSSTHQVPSSEIIFYFLFQIDEHADQIDGGRIVWQLLYINDHSSSSSSSSLLSPSSSFSFSPFQNEGSKSSSKSLISKISPKSKMIENEKTTHTPFTPLTGSLPSLSGSSSSLSGSLSPSSSLDHESIKLTTKMEIMKDEIDKIEGIVKSNQMLNTAILTGKQVSQSLKIFAISKSGKLGDVTLQSTCHSLDESSLKVSQSCTSVYLDGSEIRASVNSTIIIKYGSLIGFTSFLIWIPKLPLEMKFSDKKLSQIKGWKIPTSAKHHLSTHSDLIIIKNQVKLSSAKSSFKSKRSLFFDLVNGDRHAPNAAPNEREMRALNSDHVSPEASVFGSLVSSSNWSGSSGSSSRTNFSNSFSGVGHDPFSSYTNSHDDDENMNEIIIPGREKNHHQSRSLYQNIDRLSGSNPQDVQSTIETSSRTHASSKIQEGEKEGKKNKRRQKNKKKKKKNSIEAEQVLEPVVQLSPVPGHFFQVNDFPGHASAFESSRTRGEEKGMPLNQEQEHKSSSSSNFGPSSKLSSSSSSGSSSFSNSHGHPPEPNYCRLRYQQTDLKVVTKFYTTDHESGRESYLINREYNFDVTNLISPNVRILNPKILSQISSRTFEGMSPGKTDVQIISPITGEILSNSEIKVSADREVITHLDINLITGINLQIFPKFSDFLDNIWTAAVVTTDRLTALYQEGLFDVKLHFSDGTFTTLEDISSSDYHLSIDIFHENGAIAVAPAAPSGSSSSATYPRLIAINEGSDQLIHMSLEVPNICQRKRTQQLAMSYLTINVDFDAADDGSYSLINLQQNDANYHKMRNRNRTRNSNSGSRTIASIFPSNHFSSSSSSNQGKKSPPRGGSIITPNGISSGSSSNLDKKDFNYHRERILKMILSKSDLDDSILNSRILEPKIESKDQEIIFGLTGIELTMYFLLLIFSLAVIIFISSCLIFAFKLRAKNNSSNQQFIPYPGNLDPHRHPLTVVTSSLPPNSNVSNLGLGQVPLLQTVAIAKSSRTRANVGLSDSNDWIFLGRETLERTNSVACSPISILANPMAGNLISNNSSSSSSSGPNSVSSSNKSSNSNPLINNSMMAQSSIVANAISGNHRIVTGINSSAIIVKKNKTSKSSRTSRSASKWPGASSNKNDQMNLCPNESRALLSRSPEMATLSDDLVSPKSGQSQRVSVMSYPGSEVSIRITRNPLSQEIREFESSGSESEPILLSDNEDQEHFSSSDHHPHILDILSDSDSSSNSDTPLTIISSSSDEDGDNAQDRDEVSSGLESSRTPALKRMRMRAKAKKEQVRDVQSSSSSKYQKLEKIIKQRSGSDPIVAQEPETDSAPPVPAHRSPPTVLELPASSSEVTKEQQLEKISPLIPLHNSKRPIRKAPSRPPPIPSGRPLPPSPTKAQSSESTKSGHSLTELDDILLTSSSKSHSRPKSLSLKSMFGSELTSVVMSPEHGHGHDERDSRSRTTKSRNLDLELSEATKGMSREQKMEYFKNLKESSA